MGGNTPGRVKNQTRHLQEDAALWVNEYPSFWDHEGQQGKTC